MIVAIARHPPPKTMDKVTSADVAARAGVSRSAVSRVFTPGASASAATMEKVKQAANDLGYRPNALARSLLTGRSRIIGLVVAYLDNQFYPTALEKLSASLQAQGYHVLVFMASQTAGNVQDVAREILDYQVDGLILASVALSSDLARVCQERGIPVVLFNRDQDGADMSAVVSENFEGGRLAARHLIAKGANRIGYIAGWDGASTQKDREAGFRFELEQQGRSVAARASGNFRTEQTQIAALEMFAGPDHPDAVFVANDFMAMVVMDVLRFQLGLQVPMDVAVLGFDDVPAASWGAYNLTTLRQDIDGMVDATVTRILARINGDAAVDDAVLPVALIERGSA